jgi:hypothetical protein
MIDSKRRSLETEIVELDEQDLAEVAGGCTRVNKISDDDGGPTSGP